MLVIDESATDRRNSQDSYFDGSLELLRELAVTNDLDAAWPRLSAIVGKMLPHDALRMACFDQRGRAVVNTSTAVRARSSVRGPSPWMPSTTNQMPRSRHAAPTRARSKV